MKFPVRAGMAMLLGAGLLTTLDVAQAAPPSAAPVPDATCSTLSLFRSQLTSRIQDREPAGEVTLIDESVPALFAFNDIRGGAGEWVRHLWFYQGQLVADVRLDIGSDRWRTWSSKVVGPSAAEDWRVDVLDSRHCLLASLNATKKTGPGAPDAFAGLSALIAEGKVAEARILADELRQQPGTDLRRLDKLVDQDLAMAQVRQQIEARDLYIAGARLSRLRRQFPRDARVDALDSLHQSALEEVEKEAEVTAAVLSHYLARHGGSGVCPPAGEESTAGMHWWYPAPALKEFELLSAGEARAGEQPLVLLDRRTGRTLQASTPCLAWPPF